MHSSTVAPFNSFLTIRQVFPHCSSFIFEPDEETLYRRCVLVVPATGAASYRDAHGWSLFRDISVEP